MSKAAAKKAKEQSPISGIIKDTLIIFAITLVAGGVLGFVYELTKKPIEEQKLAKQAEACAEVFRAQDENGNLYDAEPLHFELINVNQTALKNATENSDIKAEVNEVYEARDMDNELIGYVISVITKEGYGGDIRMYMGVTMSGRLMGISILEIHETPGLGMRASEVLVPQFRDLKGTEFTVTKNGKVAENEIDAITSATITSKAVTRGVNFGLKYFDELTKGGADE